MTDPTPAGGTSQADTLNRRKQFLRMGETDEAALRDVSSVMNQRIAGALDELYVHLQASGQLDHLLTSEDVIRRLKDAQKAYYSRMAEGNWNEEYLEERTNIGYVHERVGLGPEFYLGSYAYLFAELIPTFFNAYSDDSGKAIHALQALTKIVFFDMAASIDAYIIRREENAQNIVSEFTTKLSGYVERLNGTTDEIKGATAAQTKGAQRQASAVAEITTAMAELSQTAKQALGQAENVMETTQHTIGVAREGKEAVAEVSTGMDEIRQQMETLSERILLLNEQTQQIGDIISSVSEISEQSKLLALNAAIEAARAGEHGRGFAVVATEIRNLADQSKQSTLQVRNILGDIQKATDAAVLATEQGTLAVENGATVASTAGERFNELADAVEESGESARLIATVSRQQGEGIDQIAAAMDEINKNSVESAQGMKTIDHGTRSLADLSDNIEGVLNKFLNDEGESSTPQGSQTTSDSDPVTA